MIRAGSVLVLLVSTWLSVPSAARTVAAQGTLAPLARPVWLCRPGLPGNPCNQDRDGSAQVSGRGGEFTVRYPVSGLRRTLDTTTVTPAGTTSRSGYSAPRPSSVDCFYVYPTVDVLPNPILRLGSLAPTPTDTEMAVMLTQAGRLLDRCRLFVPVYRQAPLVEYIGAALAGGKPNLAPGSADVTQAWDEYWSRYNRDPASGKRRGVIVLGHSQGTSAAADLIRRRIDGRPAQRYLVSALLIGGNVQVPAGRLAGGGKDPDSTFQHVPACHRASRRAAMPTGCVVAYSAFALQSGESLPDKSFFGRPTAPGHRVLCTNPAALLAGTAPGSNTPVDAYLPTRRLVGGSVMAHNGFLAAVAAGATLPVRPSGFVRYRGQLSARCVSGADAQGPVDWLQVDGSAAVLGTPSSSLLGLHVWDYNVALGDLVRLVDAQVGQWRVAQRRTG